MKKISLIFFAFIFIFECFGQNGSKEVIYGTVRTDGYQKITKSAMWAIRPEAKVIYEGGRPAGYTVVVLDQDYFVRFVDGENNQFDRNYIVFPKGSIVYTDDRTNQFYSAICGNKIEYIRPVDMVTIKIEPPPANIETNWAYKEPERTNQPFVPIPPIKEEKRFKVGFVVIPVAVIATGVAAYFLSQDRGHHHDPGGAPPVKPVDPIDPGGPGGAPPSGGD